MLLPPEHQAPILARAGIDTPALDSAADGLVTVVSPRRADLDMSSGRENALEHPARIGGEVGLSQWAVPEKRRQDSHQGLYGSAPRRRRLHVPWNEANLEPGAKGGPYPSQGLQFEAIPSILVPVEGGGARAGPLRQFCESPALRRPKVTDLLPQDGRCICIIIHDNIIHHETRMGQVRQQ